MKVNTHYQILARHAVSYCGLALQYQLLFYPAENQYSISVQSGNDFAEVFVGANARFAKRCYQLVKKGGVTPCTLADIIADLQKEEEFLNKPIYKSAR